MQSRILDLESGINFRELGGYKTKSGQKIKYHKILRSANLASLTDKDQTYLVNYGLKKSIDFRSIAEMEAEPDNLPNGVEYIFNPVLAEDETDVSKSDEQIKADYGLDSSNGFKHMLDVYRHMVNDDHSKNAYRIFFDNLLDNSDDNDVILFHCTAGKDRTGMGAIYFLWTLGVDTETITQDYLLTNKASEDFVNKQMENLREKGANDNIIDSAKALYSVHPDYIKAAEDEVIKQSGSVDNYITTELGISDKEIKDLRKIYLED